MKHREENIGAIKYTKQHRKAYKKIEKIVGKEEFEYSLNEEESIHKNGNKKDILRIAIRT